MFTKLAPKEVKKIDLTTWEFYDSWDAQEETEKKIRGAIAKAIKDDESFSLGALFDKVMGHLVTDTLRSTFDEEMSVDVNIKYLDTPLTIEVALPLNKDEGAPTPKVMVPLREVIIDAIDQDCGHYETHGQIYLAKNHIADAERLVTMLQAEVDFAKTLIEKAQLGGGGEE